MARIQTAALTLSLPNVIRTGSILLASLLSALMHSADTAADSPATGSENGRVSNDLVALYDFSELSGGLVHDSSGHQPPLNLKIDDPGRIRWLGGSLLIQASTRIHSGQPAQRITDALTASHALTIEAWLRPAHVPQSGPARIVSLSSNTSLRNVTLGQDGASIDVRLRTTKTSTNGIPSLVSAKDSLSAKLVHVAYTRDADGNARIYLNGSEVAKGEIVGDLSGWDSSYELLLANEATSDRPWLGELHLVAIYSRALSAEEVARNHAAGADSGDRLALKLPPAVGRAVDFVTDVQPILRARCYECHGTGNEEGGLNLGIRARVLEGGTHGAVLTAGRSSSSPLIHLVAQVDADRIMPPEGDPLTNEQIGILRAWIDQGADWPSGADVLDPRLERARGHWAFRRLTDVPPLAADADDIDAAAREVDRLIDTAMNEQKLSTAEPLPPGRLVRRLYFDLIGLPPNPAETEEFITAATADRDQAVRETVDRLLESRHYGERWGRHWLDVARYADSDGQEADRDRPEAWHYRDFVIRAFNDDLPFDTFVRWQMAGDEIEPADPQAVAATGFLTAGPHTVLEDSFLEEERLRNRYNELDDIVSTVGTGLLGLTIGCARCHDHKYDAVSAREYYRLLSAFHSGDRKIVKTSGGEDVLAFQDFGSDPRTTWLFGRGDFYDRDRVVHLGFPVVLSSERSAEQYLTDVQNAVRSSDRKVTSTLQRRALADWLTDTQHGAGMLLARVFVNRIWQHHFGHGLVKTVSDFGVRGEAPSHPELLDRLAADFIAHGWQTKRTHRLLLATRVWQRGARLAEAALNDTAQSTDPEARLLWRRTPQRLEAEAIRDAMLSASGTLNLQPYGPAFKPFIAGEAIVARNLKDGGYPKDAKDSPETRRRSVYMFHKRVVPYPLMQAFDRPDLLQSCGRRETTTVAPQALAILNDSFVRACATDFATRLVQECGDDNSQVAARSFALALSRQPSATEAAAVVAFIEQQTAERSRRGEQQPREAALADYCQSLFGLNEFIYVD